MRAPYFFPVTREEKCGMLWPSSVPPMNTQYSTIIETAEQAANTRHVEGVAFRCSKCKEVKPVGTSGGTGYARVNDGKDLVCYACADAMQREDLRDRSKPFCAYVASDGASITTWTGGKLMSVVESRPCRLTRMSFTHDRNSYRSIRARDVHGGEWVGRGSAGIVIKLRPVKS